MRPARRRGRGVAGFPFQRMARGGAEPGATFRGEAPSGWNLVFFRFKLRSCRISYQLLCKCPSQIVTLAERGGSHAPPLRGTVLPPCKPERGALLPPLQTMEVKQVKSFRSAERDRALGLVQVAILNVINRDPGRAYGSAITDQVSRVVDRELADAQVYMALRRLEEHGLVRSHVDISVPSKKSRGRPRKYYALTASGRRAMESAGAYTFSASPFMQSRGDHEGKSQEGPMPAPVVV